MDFPIGFIKLGAKKEKKKKWLSLTKTHKSKFTQNVQENYLERDIVLWYYISLFKNHCSPSNNIKICISCLQ